MSDCEISAAMYNVKCTSQAPALPGRDGMIEGEGLASKIHLMMQSDESALAALDVDAVPAADEEDDPGFCR